MYWPSVRVANRTDLAIGALEGKSTIKAEAEDSFAIMVDNGLTWRIENDAF